MVCTTRLSCRRLHRVQPSRCTVTHGGFWCPLSSQNMLVCVFPEVRAVWSLQKVQTGEHALLRSHICLGSNASLKKTKREAVYRSRSSVVKSSVFSCRAGSRPGPWQGESKALSNTHTHTHTQAMIAVTSGILFETTPVDFKKACIERRKTMSTRVWKITVHYSEFEVRGGRSAGQDQLQQ